MYFIAGMVEITQLHNGLQLANKQWGKSTAQITTLPIAFKVAGLIGFAQYRGTGNPTGNADMTVTLSKTTIQTYRNYEYNFWAIGN